MKRKDEEIKRLHNLVKIQNQEVDMRVNQKFHKELSEKEQIIINLNQKNEKQSERILSLFDENEKLKKENTFLHVWKDKAVDFMKKLNIYDKFQNLTKKINRNRGSGFER
ncbi:hypothetical protein [Massilibacterium senegalense]|uniref:hypothetical protein n=1 Tax=Massilibacterium senegalense TaxID=1632858 RepID=UPI0011CC753C|nr:hypothetical protein [Massilibacterium senegalense]